MSIQKEAIEQCQKDFDNFKEALNKEEITGFMLVATKQDGDVIRCMSITPPAILALSGLVMLMHTHLVNIGNQVMQQIEAAKNANVIQPAQSIPHQLKN